MCCGSLALGDGTSLVVALRPLWSRGMITEIWESRRTAAIAVPALSRRRAEAICLL